MLRSSLEAGWSMSRVCKENNLLHKNCTFSAKVLVKRDTFGIFAAKLSSMLWLLQRQINEEVFDCIIYHSLRCM